MQPDVAERLNLLRSDFAAVTGRPFHHFFCPVLLVDEEVELCKAHVVNAAFAQSSRRWTLQRRDVDNFFGSRFEADFVDLQLDEPGLAIKALADPGLYRRLHPQVLLDGVPIEHFVARGPVPKQFAALHVRDEQSEVVLGLKIAPGILASVNHESNWQFEVSRDLRVQAVVSVLKAAHMSMFNMLGYGYALAPNGVWLGNGLGSFFLENMAKPRAEVLRAAALHFLPVVAMVRPVEAMPSAFSGTVDDGWLHFCWSEPNNPVPWGMLTYIRTGESLHAALLPTMADEGVAERFARFLEKSEDAFDVSAVRFEGTHWSQVNTRQLVRWPAANWRD